MTAVSLSILIGVPGFCIDLDSDAAVIFDYPGGTASLAATAFGQPLHEETKYSFLLDLLSYLKKTMDVSNGKYEIEITGPLPSSAHGAITDFFLTGPEEGNRDLLYRYGASASYKRAAIILRRIESPDEITTEAIAKQNIEFSTDLRVKTGDVVKVILISGALQLEVEGEALQSGTGLDQIKVKVRGTGRELVGMIAAPMEVHVVL